MKLAAQSLLNILTEAVGVGGEFDTAKIGLVEDADPITPETQLADLTLAQYEGYAASAAVTWGTPHLDSEGRAVCQAGPKEFKPTGDATTSEVNQVILLNNAGTAILASYVLEEPLSFVDEQSVYLIGFPVMLSQPSGSEAEILP